MTQAFKKYLLSAYCGPGSLLGTRCHKFQSRFEGKGARHNKSMREKHNPELNYREENTAYVQFYKSFLPSPALGDSVANSQKAHGAGPEGVSGLETPRVGECGQRSGGGGGGTGESTAGGRPRAPGAAEPSRRSLPTRRCSPPRGPGRRAEPELRGAQGPLFMPSRTPATAPPAARAPAGGRTASSSLELPEARAD